MRSRYPELEAGAGQDWTGSTTLPVSADTKELGSETDKSLSIKLIFLFFFIKICEDDRIWVYFLGAGIWLVMVMKEAMTLFWLDPMIFYWKKKICLVSIIGIARQALCFHFFEIRVWAPIFSWIRFIWAEPEVFAVLFFSRNRNQVVTSVPAPD